MRFLPTVNLLNPALHDAVLSGQLRLQCGQWIETAGGVSRFVGVTDSGIIYAAHRGAGGVVSRERFDDLRHCFPATSKSKGAQ